MGVLSKTKRNWTMGKPKKKEYELEVYFPQVPPDLEEVLHSHGFERKGELSESETSLNPLGCWKSWREEAYTHRELTVKINYFTAIGMSPSSTIADRKNNWCNLSARLIISTPSKSFAQEAIEKQEEMGRILRDRYHARLYDPQFMVEVDN